MVLHKHNLLMLPYELACQQEAGVDEAGRGCGAGPVCAAAVILPEGFAFDGLRDSKKMSASARNEAARYIKENAVAWSIGEATVAEIDAHNILKATYLAMFRAIKGLIVEPQLLLIDGNRFVNHTTIPFRTIVKGDDKVMAIAAASVLSKTHRDDVMAQLHDSFPAYGWIKNKGYLTLQHRNACGDLGLTQHHRKSFQIIKAPTLFEQ